MKRFKTPKQWLGDLDAEEAATLIEAAADIALVLDNAGIIRDVAFAQEDLAREFASAWLNRSWIDVASIDTKVKAEALLRDAPTPGARRWRHINHPASRGPDVPILYAAMPFGGEGRNLIVGRDLRPIAILQQRLVDAQQSMERDYSRLRDIETRYRQLFHTAVEAMLVVDAGSNRLTETNPAAEKLLATSNSGLVGQPFANCFDPQAAGTVLDLLASAKASGRTETARVRLAGGGPEIMVSCTLYRQESSTFLLVRLAPQGVLAAPTPMMDDRAKLLSAVEKAPDAFVVTGPDGRILDVNAAFLDMVQLATDDQAKGESLDRWLGRPGVDLSVLLASLRQHGMVRLFATTLRGEYGANAEIEVSAAAISDGGQSRLAFVIRNVERRLSAQPRATHELPRSVEQLTELVGRVPLKDLVRETTDVIERLCIEAALELTNDNRASAAEILGLSRQSLYVKLRRYGLGDLGAEPEP